MRSDDLTPLLGGQGKGQSLGFRQGVIVSWDTNTAENTVVVGGTLMQNLPILNTSEAAILAAGDVVGILVAGNTWGILGRFTYPGSPEAVSSLSSLRTQSASVDASEGTSSQTFVDLTTVGPSVDVNIGASGRALVTLSSFVDSSGATAQTSRAGGVVSFEVSGANTLAADLGRALFTDIVLNNVNPGTNTNTIGLSLQMSRQVLLTGLNPGVSTFTCKYRSYETGRTANFQFRNITVIAL